MYANMKKLINQKFYKTVEEVYEKLDVFFAMNRVTADQYIELCALAEEKYAPPVVEEVPEEA